MKNTFNFRSTGRTAVIAAVCAGSLMMGGCASMKSTWDGMSQTGQGATAGGAAGAAPESGLGTAGGHLGGGPVRRGHPQRPVLHRPPEREGLRRPAPVRAQPAVA